MNLLLNILPVFLVFSVYNPMSDRLITLLKRDDFSVLSLPMFPTPKGTALPLSWEWETGNSLKSLQNSGKSEQTTSNAMWKLDETFL